MGFDKVVKVHLRTVDVLDLKFFLFTYYLGMLLWVALIELV